MDIPKAEVKLCRSCQFEIMPSNNFCSKCGKKANAVMRPEQEIIKEYEALHKIYKENEGPLAKVALSPLLQFAQWMLGESEEKVSEAIINIKKGF